MISKTRLISTEISPRFIPHTYPVKPFHPVGFVGLVLFVWFGLVFSVFGSFRLDLRFQIEQFHPGIDSMGILPSSQERGVTNIPLVSCPLIVFVVWGCFKCHSNQVGVRKLIKLSPQVIGVMQPQYIVINPDQLLWEEVIQKNQISFSCVRAQCVP